MSTLTIDLDADRFALLDQGWLVVGGEPFDDLDAFIIEHNIDVPTYRLQPPAALSALVGKACETCGGHGQRVPYLRVGLYGAPPAPCPGITTLVRLTGEAVPIVDRRNMPHHGELITVNVTGTVNWHHAPDPKMSWSAVIEPIDLGPDPQRWIGWFAYPCEVIP